MLNDDDAIHSEPRGPCWMWTLVKSDGMDVPATALVGVFILSGQLELGRWAGDENRATVRVPRGPPLCEPFMMVGILEVLPRECATSTHSWETKSCCQ